MESQWCFLSVGLSASARRGWHTPKRCAPSQRGQLRRVTVLSHPSTERDTCRQGSGGHSTEQVPRRSEDRPAVSASWPAGSSMNPAPPKSPAEPVLVYRRQASRGMGTSSSWPPQVLPAYLLTGLVGIVVIAASLGTSNSAAGSVAGSECTTAGPIPGLDAAAAANARTVAATASSRGGRRAP